MNARAAAIKDELGPEGIKTYEAIKKMKRMAGGVQARLPFEFVIE